MENAMILIGACRLPRRAEAAVVVAEAALSGGKKRYRLLEVDRRLDTDPAVFVEEIYRRLKDGGLCRRKRLYSQDRRPNKTLTDRPKVVALEDGAGTVDSLRDRGVVVEAIRFAAVEKWERALVGKALGANYVVAPDDVLNTAETVYAEGRVDPPERQKDGKDPLILIERLSGDLSSPGASRAGEVPASALAAALLLWFRETVPYRRTYRAN
jgi:hypothetical protein